MRDETYIEYAAHVGHGVEHTSTRYQDGLTIVGTLIGIGVCVGRLRTGVGIVTCVAAIQKWKNWGRKLGTFLDDRFVKREVTEHLGTGFESVRLGPHAEPAARANEDSAPREQHQSNCVTEGSRIVFLGPEIAPMGRRRDRTNCGGQLVEGLETLAVGGLPSAEGEPIPEIPGEFSARVSLLSAAIDLSATFAKGGLTGVAESQVKKAVRAHGGGLLVDGYDLARNGLPTRSDSLAQRWKQIGQARQIVRDGVELGQRILGH